MTATVSGTSRAALVGAGAAAVAGGPWRRGLSPAVIVAGLVTAFFCFAAIFPGTLCGVSPNEADPLAALQSPSWTHLFGTDELGRDIFTRVVYGARPSLAMGFGATAVGVAGGILLGLAAGLGGRFADTVVMRAVDVLLAFPGILLALLVLALAGPGTSNAVVAIGLGAVPGYARVLRGQVLVVRKAGYVEAATALGLRRSHVGLVHVLPNALSPVLVLATIGIGATTLAGASLSFLGLGPKPPTAEWGAMLADGQNYLGVAWWLPIFPGIAITVAVVAITVVGRSVQRRYAGRSSA